MNSITLTQEQFNQMQEEIRQLKKERSYWKFSFNKQVQLHRKSYANKQPSYNS